MPWLGTVNDLASTPVGFIGLGLMGRPLAARLHRAQVPLVVHNRSRAAVDELAALGHTAARTPREVAEKTPGALIVLLLPDSAAVEQVLNGPDGLWAGLQPGTLVIDMGSSRVDATRAWAETARSRGADWLDAPVSGGQAGAIAGTLSIMVGGTEAAFSRAKPYFERLGRTVTYLGPSGAGQVTKLANQIVVAVTISAVAEALALASANGADVNAVRSALLGGFAASKVLDAHGRRMIEGDFQPGGRAVLQLKDLHEAARVAAAAQLDLSVLRHNLGRWEELIARGWGELDHSAFSKLYEPSSSTS